VIANRNDGDVSVVANRCPAAQSRKSGAAGHAAVLCSKCDPRTVMAGARCLLAEPRVVNNGPDGNAGLRGPQARRLACGEVVRGAVGKEEMIAHGSDGDVVKRLRTVSTAGSMAATRKSLQAGMMWTM
jgi:hypothetical protein